MPPVMIFTAVLLAEVQLDPFSCGISELSSTPTSVSKHSSNLAAFDIRYGPFSRGGVSFRFPMLMVGGRSPGYLFFGGYPIPLKASIILRVRPY